VQRRKKAKKKPQTSLSQSEQRLLTSLFDKIQNSGPEEIVAAIPDSRCARIFVDRLPLKNPSAKPIIAAIIEKFQDKHTRKAVKRGLFRLKKMGIPIDDLQINIEDSTSILKPPPIEKPVCYIGPILDMSGFRAILILIRSLGKGRRVGTGLVSDEKGIDSFLYVTFGTGKIREIMDDLSQNAGPLVETSLSHIATILEGAYRQHVRLHPEAPEHYLALRPWLLENATLVDRPVVYDVLSEEAVSDVMLTESQLEKLFQNKLMKSWLLDFEHIKPIIEEIKKVEESSIILTDAQKLQQERKIRDKCIKELFHENATNLLKCRFEEMAYMFFSLGEKDMSRLCLAAARSMDTKETILEANPVIDFIYERSLKFFLAASPEKSDRPSEQKEKAASPIIIA